MKSDRKASSIRRPTQRRARMTVEAILDAVIKILKRDGADAVTTNRIAEVAGVSIGSVYQYFPDKRAIFEALHQRHVEEIDRLVERTLIEHPASPLDKLVRAMMEALVDAHAKDPELYQALMRQVPHRTDSSREFAVRLHGVFRLAIASRRDSRRRRQDPDKQAFVVAHMVDALSHGVILRRPQGLSLEVAKEEAIRAVLTYLRA
jgi:AcrR family transcriptional regulator